MNTKLFILLAFIALYSCSEKSKESDAFGYFEADQTIISAEATGKLLEFTIEEGEKVAQGQVVGLIDSLQLHFKKQQLIAQKGAMASNLLQLESQVAVIEQQVANLNKDLTRINNLLKTGAATPKQKDDIEGQILVLGKQRLAVETQREGVNSQIKTIDSQIDEINYNISKTQIISPVSGDILTKMVMKGELATAGKPLFTVADLNNIKLKAYISGNQLPLVKLNQKVKIKVDDGNGGLIETEGSVIWISATSEFTPKTIQTNEERLNLVYAIKIKVVNDGSLKIGMPGEVVF